MVKLNKHARMRARQRVRGESYAVVASDYGVSPLREGGGQRQAGISCLEDGTVELRCSLALL